jgi:hypothetical protein
LPAGIVVLDGRINFELNLTKLIVIEDSSALELVLIRNLSLLNLRALYFNPEALDELVDVVKDAKVRHGDDDSVTLAGSKFLRRTEFMLLVTIHTNPIPDGRLDMKEFFDPGELFGPDYATEPNFEHSIKSAIKLNRYEVSVVEVVLKVVFQFHVNHLSFILFI